MPARDLHQKPFDAGTKVKLSIYRSYVRAWLQVFLHAGKFLGQPLCFFDFFCGPGEDCTGYPGSPIILIEELLAQLPAINARRHELQIFFNDKDASKIDHLTALCGERNLPGRPRIQRSEFAKAFHDVQAEIGISPSLVFIDQNGIKQITRPIFEKLTTGTTDFLFFTASSYAWRFGDSVAPDLHFPEGLPYAEVHRVLAAKYREWAPQRMFIGHFSIKKESNIYGLVFGSSSWRGMQKFVDIVWRLDAESGEANYEIEPDSGQGEYSFEEGTVVYKKRKIEAFQELLADEIRAKRVHTDKDVFLHCLTNGFQPRVAKKVYGDLRAGGVLKHQQALMPRISDECMKHPRKLEV